MTRSRGCPALLVCAALIGPAVGAAGAEAPAASLTLADCYRLAVKRSDTIAAQDELIRETEGRFLQSLSGILPHASFSMSEKQQDAAGDSPFRLKEVPEYKFTFSQPLFAGFKEFAAMAGSRAERRQREQEVRSARLLLLVDVSDAFHLHLQSLEDLEALTATHAALEERIAVLTERQRLGRSRPSEAVSARAQLRRVEAELELIRGQTLATQRLLEFLTGLEPIGPLQDDQVDLPPLDEAASDPAKADARPDVRAAAEALAVAEQEVRVARADFLPTVDLDGNYYTKRVGNTDGVDWDATLTLDVPIFQGGQALGRTREAAARARTAALRLSETRRRAWLEIQDAAITYAAARKRAEAFERALAAADEDYRLQTAEYQHQLVSNLDVLRALQDLLDARRNAISARRDAKRRYWSLRAALGEPLE